MLLRLTEGLGGGIKDFLFEEWSSGLKERPGNPPGTRGPLRLRNGPLGLKAKGILVQRLL